MKDLVTLVRMARVRRREERIIMHRFHVSREFAQAAIQLFDLHGTDIEEWKQGKAELAAKYPEEFARWMPPQKE